MKKVSLLLGAYAMLLVGCGTATQYLGKPPTQAGTAQGAAEQAAAKPIKAEQLGQALLAGKAAAVYDQTSADFKQSISKTDFENTFQQLNATIKEWKHHSQLRLNGDNFYDTWLDQDGKFALTAVTDSKGTITTLLVKPLETFPATDNTLTKLSYQAPFKGDWYVFLHNATLAIGDLNGAIGRRAVTVERLHYAPDGALLPVVQTEAGVSAP